MNHPSAHHFATVLLGIAAIFILSACGDSEPDAAAAGPQRVTPAAPINPQSAAVTDILKIKARKEAAGLGQGKVTVHGAWNYTGYSTLTPLPEARLVAVDITINNYTSDFEFNDIEIYDGALLMSYGSEPNIAVLDSSGKLESDPTKLAGAPGPTRLLLVYGFPKNSKIFNLVYWGKKLNFTPIQPADSGWEVPYPSTPPAPAPAPAPAKAE